MPGLGRLGSQCSYGWASVDVLSHDCCLTFEQKPHKIKKSSEFEPKLPTIYWTRCCLCPIQVLQPPMTSVSRNLTISAKSNTGKNRAIYNSLNAKLVHLYPSDDKVCLPTRLSHHIIAHKNHIHPNLPFCTAICLAWTTC